MEEQMSKFGDLVGKELVWAAVKGQKNHYEMRSGSTLLGTLIWDKSEVRGECDGKRWRFSREGFFRPRLLIHEDGSNETFASLEVGAIGSGRLAFADGRNFSWVQRGLFSSTWGFVDENKTPLLSFKLTSGLLTTGATATLEDKAANLPDAPMLAVLGWFVLVLYAEDAAPTGL